MLLRAGDGCQWCRVIRLSSSLSKVLPGDLMMTKIHTSRHTQYKFVDQVLAELPAPPVTVDVDQDVHPVIETMSSYAAAFYFLISIFRCFGGSR